MFLNDSIFLYIGEKAKWDIYVPCLQINTQKYSQFIFYFFSFKMLQISQKNVFFINIFKLGRSGVKNGSKSNTNSRLQSRGLPRI